MDVGESSFNEIISQARTQFIVPVWQRLYSWDQKEWTDLWQDLLNLYDRLHTGEPAEHFMGAIVVKTIEEKVGEITRRILIDGQQRLTTLLLICALIRDIVKAEGNDNLANEIEDSLLFNKYAKRTEDKPKLCPTEADLKVFDLAIHGGGLEGLDVGSQIISAYTFFKDLLERNKGKYNPEGLLNSIRKFKIVTIRLDEKDNPNRIFETLNYRGKELSQSDLIRNYFMMAIKDLSKADQNYKNIWFPMQQSLGSYTLERMKNLEAFLRHYIVMLKHETINENKVYAEMQGRLKHSEENQVISELNTIRKYSYYYERLLYPSREKDSDISKGLIRLKKLKVGVHYPFLLKVYHGFNNGLISKDEFCIILKTIESYIVRRFFQRLPTNALNKLFASLCELPETDIIGLLQRELAIKRSWSTQYWPRDDEFKENVRTRPIYSISPERCRFVLETFEEEFMHPEGVKLDSLWIEHVMPETLNEKWQTYLGSNWRNIYNNYVHTIGNLSLIAPSPDISISNDLFSEKKKEWYSVSNVSLTKEINQKWNEWTEKEIQDKAHILAERAVKIWPRPEYGIMVNGKPISP
jgi:uncharacterized protein with ParB-like and HNH nuclease domain